MVHLYIKRCNKNLKGNDLHTEGLSLLSEALHDQQIDDLSSEEIENRLTLGNHGKPALKNPNIQFNISNTSGLVICGLCHSPVGVDTEKVRDYKPAVFRKVFTEDERICLPEDPDDQAMYFFRLWTLKEARLKLSGEGLLRPMTDFSFHFPGSSDQGITCSDPDIHAWQMVFENEYIISVCTDQPSEITIHLLHSSPSAPI